MPSNEISEGSVAQGVRGMEIKRRVRERLQSEGLSIEGYRQLLNQQPIERVEDREVIQKLVIAPVMKDVAAQLDAESNRSGFGDDGSAA